MKSKLVCLIIRDGWGKGNPDVGNAIHMAHTPHTDHYEQNFPFSLIQSSGLSVGLPKGYQGNSEVGHLNIGTGKIVYQSLTRIDQAISSGEFHQNQTLRKALHIARERKSTIHLVGLIQEEGVHAVTRHCITLLEMCQREKLRDVVIHAVADGRDTPPQSAQKHLQFLQDGIDRTGTGKIATVCGRYYAMDRDKRWNRTELAYRAVMEGKGKIVSDWQEAIAHAYAAGETDEFIKPRIIDYKGIHPDDIMIFFNFRFDRTRQLTQAIAEPDFPAFQTISHHMHLVTMTHYYDNGHFDEIFPELEHKNILGEVIATQKIRQLRIAETEKYAHVTFFLNGLRNDPFEGEDRILVSSPKVATYDLKPEMSVHEVKDKLIQAIKSNTYRLIVCNFANCDMVGHTGKFDKIVQAVETVDQCSHDVTQAVLAAGGIVILTGDHGNAEQTKLEDGSPMTSHTTNPVPLSLVGAGYIKLRPEGELCDIAPTILELMGIKQPEEMTGTSLILKE